MESTKVKATFANEMVRSGGGGTAAGAMHATLYYVPGPGEPRSYQGELAPGESLEVTTYQGHDWQIAFAPPAGEGGGGETAVWTISAARDGRKQTLAVVDGRWRLREGKAGSPELAQHPGADQGKGYWKHLRELRDAARGSKDEL